MAVSGPTPQNSKQTFFLHTEIYFLLFFGTFGYIVFIEDGKDFFRLFKMGSGQSCSRALGGQVILPPVFSGRPINNSVLQFIKELDTNYRHIFAGKMLFA